jgi:hypothetical protein
MEEDWEQITHYHHQRKKEKERKAASVSGLNYCFGPKAAQRPLRESLKASRYLLGAWAEA